MCDSANMAAVETSRESSVSVQRENSNVDLLNVDEYKGNLVITSKGNFEWFGEFGTLQGLFDRLLKKQTKWSKPSGGCRKLEVDELIVRWYSGNHSLTVNGIKDEEIKRHLRDLAKEEADHDINMSENSFDKQEHKGTSHSSTDDDELSESR